MATESERVTVGGVTLECFPPDPYLHVHRYAHGLEVVEVKELICYLQRWVDSKRLHETPKVQS